MYQVSLILMTGKEKVIGNLEKKQANILVEKIVSCKKPMINLTEYSPRSIEKWYFNVSTIREVKLKKQESA